MNTAIPRVPQSPQRTLTVVQPQQDLAALIAASQCQESSDSDSAASSAAAGGKLAVWLVRDFKLLEWPSERIGEFYAADSFLVLNSYQHDGEICVSAVP